MPVCLVGGANSQSLLHPSLFKWKKIRAVEPIALMIDSIILNGNCKESVSIIKKNPPQLVMVASYWCFTCDLHLTAGNPHVLPASASHAGDESTQCFVSGEPPRQLRDREPAGFPSPIRSCLGSRAQGCVSCAEVAEPARGGKSFHSRGICRAGSFKGGAGKATLSPNL